MKSNKAIFLDAKLKTLDTKFSESHTKSADSIATPKSLEELLAHTAFQMKEVQRGLDLYINNGRVSRDNYDMARSINTLYRAESHVDVIASNKTLIQPRIQGLDINVYYKYSEGRKIYEFAKVTIANPLATQELSPDELNITDNIRHLMSTFVNMPEIVTIPHYINNQSFIANGCGLNVDEDAPPSIISVSVCLTVPALDIIKTGLDLEMLIRGWLHAPNEMLKKGYPKLNFVATDIRSNQGYLSPDFEIPKDINKCIKYFQLTKKSLLGCLNDAGFETAICFTSGNDTSLVRGTVMGASHLCIENYISPALESIKATKTRIRSLKTDKARDRFIKSTLDKSEDSINILNYLRTFKYFTLGITVEPNYLIIHRRVINVLSKDKTQLYVDPSIVSKINDASVLELIQTMGISVADAVEVVEYTGYEGHRNIFSKKMIRDIDRELGIVLTEHQVGIFRDNFERIKKNRETNSTPNLIMLRERLWTQ